MSQIVQTLSSLKRYVICERPLRGFKELKLPFIYTINRIIPSFLTSQNSTSNDIKELCQKDDEKE